MSTVKIFPPASGRPDITSKNPFPQLLQTPSGLAILEMQGTINLPTQDYSSESTSFMDESNHIVSKQTSIGRLVFPEYDPEDPSNTAWMNRVYMYVGKHQRLTGEVKKLARAIAVVRKRRKEGEVDVDAMSEDGEDAQEELEIVEIVKYKLLFSLRPEPVGASVIAAAAAPVIVPEA